MTKSRIYQMMNEIIAYWRDEGDDAPAIELWYDAIHYVRWRILVNKLD